MDHCLLCGVSVGPAHPLCEGCTADCPFLESCCRQCGRALPESGWCGRCLRSPPPFDRVVAPFRYAYPVDRLLWEFKYHGRLPPLRLFAQELAAAVCRTDAPYPDCLLPVPLHRWRLWQRGFNQSLEIARLTGKLLHIPVDRKSLRRRCATPAQTGLASPARRRNVRGAFEVSAKSLPRHVAVVDDVMTTGATLAEICRTLRRAGVEQIQVWVAARTDSG